MRVHDEAHLDAAADGVLERRSELLRQFPDFVAFAKTRALLSLLRQIEKDIQIQFYGFVYSRSLDLNDNVLAAEQACRIYLRQGGGRDGFRVDGFKQLVDWRI